MLSKLLLCLGRSSILAFMLMFSVDKAGKEGLCGGMGERLHALDYRMSCSPLYMFSL